MNNKPLKYDNTTLTALMDKCSDAYAKMRELYEAKQNADREYNKASTAYANAKSEVDKAFRMSIHYETTVNQSPTEQ